MQVLVLFLIHPHTGHAVDSNGGGGKTMQHLGPCVECMIKMMNGRKEVQYEHGQIWKSKGRVVEVEKIAVSCKCGGKVKS